MKNINTFSLFVMSLTICVSCVKEEDITESETEVIIQEGDDFLNLIKGDVFSRYETIGFHLGYCHSL